MEDIILTNSWELNQDINANLATINSIIPNNYSINCIYAVINSIMRYDYYINCKILYMNSNIVPELIHINKQIYGPKIVQAYVLNPNDILNICPDCIMLFSNNYLCDNIVNDRFLVVRNILTKQSYINENHPQYHNLSAELIASIKNDFMINVALLLTSDFTNNIMYKNACK